MLRPDRGGPLDVDKIVTHFANAGSISPCVSVWKKVIVARVRVRRLDVMFDRTEVLLGARGDFADILQ